jgi:hypothetical protein
MATNAGETPRLADAANQQRLPVSSQDLKPPRMRHRIGVGRIDRVAVKPPIWLGAST